MVLTTKTNQIKVVNTSIQEADALCISRAENESIKQPVSVNRATPIPTTEATIETVNSIGEQEGQPEGVQFSDMNGSITLQEFVSSDNDDDSNASNDDEIDDERKMEEQDATIDDADPDSPGFGNDKLPEPNTIAQQRYSQQ